MDAMKICSKCKVEKPLAEFGTAKKRRHGKRSACKECEAKVRALRRDERNAKQRAQYRANPEKKKAKNRAWSIANAEYHAALKAKWVREHPEQSRQQALDWYRDNLERATENGARWRAANKGKIAAKQARHRVVTLQATPAWANKSYIEDTYANAAFRTKRTGTPWHVDHIVPLKSKLVCGLHWEDNLRVIPARDNQKKNNTWWPDMWEQA